METSALLAGPMSEAIQLVGGVHTVLRIVHDLLTRLRFHWRNQVGAYVFSVCKSFVSKRIYTVAALGKFEWEGID